jgi:REP element-mobilizing transposase RayT
MNRFDAQVLAYCLMGNHYHLVVMTRQANLSRLMRQINGVFTQRFNRRHDKVGHLFQGRFKSILVDRDSYLLEVCRYVELNPVRAGRVRSPVDWPWSSYHAHTGLAEVPAWLDTVGLLNFVAGRSLQTPQEARSAAKRYAKFVGQGINTPPEKGLWETALRSQIYLGDEAFVARMQAKAERSRLSARQIPARQRKLPKSIADWMKATESREQGVYAAYTKGGYTMTAIAAELGVSVAMVSKLMSSSDGRM